MAGIPRIGYSNEKTLLQPLLVGGIWSRELPQSQAPCHRDSWNSLAVCDILKVIAYKRILLLDNWRLWSSGIIKIIPNALILTNSHITLVEFYIGILRAEKVTFGIMWQWLDSIYNWLKFDLYLPCVHLAVETFGDNGSHQNPVTLTGSQRESSQDKPSSGSHSPSGLLLYANVFGKETYKVRQRNKELGRSENDSLSL